MHGGIRVAAIAAALALLSLAAPAEAKERKDPNDTRGPLDIAKVSVEQSAFRLVVKLRGRDPWSLKRLDDSPRLREGWHGRYACFDLRQDEKRRLLCAAHKRGKQRLSLLRVRRSGPVGKRRTIKGARIERPSRKSLKARFRFKRARLHKGGFKWRALTGWDEPACRPDPPPVESEPPPIGEDPPKPPEPKPPADCTDRAPDSGLVKAKIRRPRLVGCTASGPLVRSHGSRRKKRVALTFDDGPSAYTSSVIRILNRKRAKGTFYVIGQEISGRPSLLRKMLRGGHLVGNHSMHHSFYPSRFDMAAVNHRVKGATAFKPCTFRPPGGAINGTVASNARRLGMTSILWDVDTQDWSTPGSGAIYGRVVSNVRPGSIVLMHDGGGYRGQTVDALPSIISNLKHRGYRLVTVERLLRERLRWKP